MIDAVFRLGSYEFNNPLILAPMAGVSDSVFRNLCIEQGADYAVSEMVASNPKLRETDKTRRRLDQTFTNGIRIIQIAGADPDTLADTARFAVASGADVVDINMGCPAKKVCNKQAGSALMRDERLVGQLLEAVVGAVAVPITLKMRTGWEPSARNAPRIATLAEKIGIQLLTVHGRTRACGFKGPVEYETIRRVKESVSIPVIANGDITNVSDALNVLSTTRCDGLMIGRAAYGNPWIFTKLKAGLSGLSIPAQPSRHEKMSTVRRHVAELHALYGDPIGSRVARKHVGWYANLLPDGLSFRRAFNQIECAQQQLRFLENYQNDPPGALAA